MNHSLRMDAPNRHNGQRDNKRKNGRTDGQTETRLFVRPFVSSSLRWSLTLSLPSILEPDEYLPLSDANLLRQFDPLFATQERLSPESFFQCVQLSSGEHSPAATSASAAVAMATRTLHTTASCRGVLDWRRSN